MTYTDDDIPKSFRRNERRRVATVGEMIAELQQLPSDLPIYTNEDERPRVYVTRVISGCEEWLAATFDYDELGD